MIGTAKERISPYSNPLPRFLPLALAPYLFISHVQGIIKRRRTNGEKAQKISA